MKILSFFLFFFILLTPVGHAEKIYDIYTGFNAGELSPLLDGQVNFDKYKLGAKTMTNFFPHVQGPISNRSGFKYVAEVKTSSKKTRLIPFEFSKEQAYVIEMGDQYFRFYMNGGQIQTVDANTLLYLRMNGDDASTTFTDEGTTVHTITPNGNAQIDTAYKKFGTGSGLFDGNGDYLTVPDHADFDFSGGNWTVDFWLRVDDLGITWTERSNPKNFLLRDIVWNSSQFVAVGFADGTDAYIVTSSDGTTWTERSNPKNFDLYSITWDGSQFVAVGAADGTDAYIITSSDGITWAEQSNPKNFALRGVEWANSQFVAVGDPDGTDAYIVTSPNGTTWTERSNPKNFLLYTTAWDGSQYLSVGYPDGTDAYIITSPDGITWSEQSNPSNTRLVDVVWGNSQFVAVGLTAGIDAYIITSSDGITWTERSNPKNKHLYGIEWADSQYVAVGNADGTDSYILTSLDGITWVEKNNPKNFALYDTAHDGSQFVAVGGADGTDAYIVTSSSDNIIYYQQNTGDADEAINIELESDRDIKLSIKTGGSDVVSLTTTGSAISLDTWTHVAIVESGNDYYIYVDGVEKVTSSDTDRAGNYTDLVNIHDSATTSWIGWLDELRVSDTARWTAAFTPPTLEYMVSAGTTLEVAHTYDEDELFDVQYTQSADTLYLVHPDHVPAKLERTAHTSWTLTDLPFTKTNLDPTSGEIANSGFGSFTAANLVDGDLTTVGFDGDTAAANSYIQIDLGASGDLTYVGARFYTETSGAFITFDVKYSDNASDWTNTTATGWDLSDGAGWHKVSWNDPGAHRYWRFNKTNAAQEGGDVTELEMFIDSLPSTWGSGSYPSSIAFFENRLWYAYLQTIWASKSGDYYNLTLGADPDDAMQYTLLSNQINAVQWMSPGKVLVVGTTGGEYKVSASNLEEAVTPLNIRIVKQSSYGSAAIQPETVRDVTLYVQKNNRKVREFTYSWERDTYVSPDLTALAEHITNSGIKEIAYQPSPYSMLWAVKNNGDIAALTYDRESDTVAWTKQTTDGNFESVAVIPSIAGNDYDEVWVIVQRTINGSSVRYIELLQPQFDHDDSIEDAFFVDSGLSYDGVSTSSVSGLDHLEGETVSVLADGVVFDDAVVSSGAITLKLATVTTPATKVHAGLPYTSTYQSMRHEIKDAKGTTQGRTKRINKAVFRVHNTLQYQYGYTPTGDFRTQTYSSMTSGDKELDLPRTMASANFGYITIKNSKPTPITILAIIVEVNTWD